MTGTGWPSRLDGPPRRIAVLRALQLGDLLQAVPALRALRATFPGAEITLVGLPWAATFVERFGPYLDRFVPFEGFPGIAEVPVVPERVAAFLAAQRAYRYDLVIQMHGSGNTSNPCALAFGGRITAGYVDGPVPAGLAVAAPYPHDEPELVRNLRLVGLLGCPTGDRRLEFPLSAGDRAEAAGLLALLQRDRGRIVGLHAGARAPSRRWPPEYFAAVASYLMERWGAQIVLTGGRDDAEQAHTVARHMPAPPLDLVGQTSLGGLGAVIEACDLFISNDTGPAHVAVAVETPSVTIFGPVDPVRWAPLDRALHPIARHPVACSPCGHAVCPIDHRCLRGLPPATVIALADNLLMREAVACAV